VPQSRPALTPNWLQVCIIALKATIRDQCRITTATHLPPLDHFSPGLTQNKKNERKNNGRKHSSKRTKRQKEIKNKKHIFNKFSNKF
jgi:hypothetical protein